MRSADPGVAGAGTVAIRGSTVTPKYTRTTGATGAYTGTGARFLPQPDPARQFSCLLHGETGPRTILRMVSLYIVTQEVRVKVQVVQDLICPWCYIGHHNLERALSEWTAGRDTPVELEWLPYQLDPLEEGAPQEGFQERFQRRKGVAPEQMMTMFDRVTQAGAAL